MSANIQEVIASLDQLGGALREIADLDNATAAARTRLGAVEAQIARKSSEADSASKQVSDLNARVAHLKAQVAALESDFDTIYQKRNEAQTALRVAREAHAELRAKINA